MKLGIRNEQAGTEKRVAVAPASIASFVDLGFSISIESGAGTLAGYPDTAYLDAGASIVQNLSDGEPIDLLVRITPPVDEDRDVLAPSGVIVGLVDPATNNDRYSSWGESGITTISIEMVPRTTIAQAMDALSSQANAAGYAAVLLGVNELPKFLPMLVTAAGTIPPANVLILGVGVAGLQAIATAKRLGAVVYAYDIRPETKEQVESLGGRFIEAPTQKMD